MVDEREWRARKAVDDAIRVLWSAFRRLSDFGADKLTDHDAELWAQVAQHRAIQDRINQASEGGDHVRRS